MAEFDFDAAINKSSEKINWICDQLIPAGQLLVFLAQAGVGKSLMVENLGICVVSEVPFAGYDVVGSDVLIIDQDTPKDRLITRLAKFSLGTHSTPKHKLFVESMEGHFLKSDIIKVINAHPTAKLVIIDSLYSVAGNVNINLNSDMTPILSRIKQNCLKPDRTILFNHHISEKKEVPIELLMQGDPHQFSMAASAIIQQADTYYIIGATATNGTTQKIYFRPVAKRMQISTKPIIISINQTDNGERMDFLSMYEPDLDTTSLDVMTLFRDKSLDDRYLGTIKEIYDTMGHTHAEKDIREALAILAEKGMLILTKHGHNLFKYHLP